MTEKTPLVAVAWDARKNNIAAVMTYEGDGERAALVSIDTTTKNIEIRTPFKIHLFRYPELMRLNDRFVLLFSWAHNSSAFAILDVRSGKVRNSGFGDWDERNGKVYLHEKLIFDPAKN